MKRARLLSLSVLSLLALCSAAPMLPAQNLYRVNVVTTGLNGVEGGMAFDLIDGDNDTANNTAIITNFATDGMLTGNIISTGLASGNLPGQVRLQDSGFSEYFHGMTFGNSISFMLSLTNNFASPGAPDELSFFLTNPDNTDTIVPTDDPTGANALFIIDSTGRQGSNFTIYSTGNMEIFASIVPESSVPEPSALSLTVIGLFVGGIFVHPRLRRRSG